MKHTFQKEKNAPCSGDDVHMAPIPAAPQPDPAQPAAAPGIAAMASTGSGCCPSLGSLVIL